MRSLLDDKMGSEVIAYQAEATTMPPERDQFGLMARAKVRIGHVWRVER